MNPLRHWLLPWQLVSCFLCSATFTDEAFAIEGLRPSLARIAKATQWAMEERGATGVVIGQFPGPPALASSAGPGIRRMLSDELAKLGVREIRVGADLGVRGQYFVKTESIAESTSSTLVIEATFVDQAGQRLRSLDGMVEAEVRRGEDGVYPEVVRIEDGAVVEHILGSKNDIDGSGILAEVIGGTVDFGPPAKRLRYDQPNRDLVRESLRSTSAYITRQNWVFASRASDFAVCIKSNGVRKPIEIIDGQLYVDLRKGEEFQIGLSNGNTRYYAAAVTTLDGVNTFAFGPKYLSGPKKGQPRYSRWIIDPDDTHTIEGWDMGNEQARAFLVTDFANSAAAKLRSTTGIGTITVCYRLLWRPGHKPPSDEPEMMIAGDAAEMGGAVEMGNGASERPDTGIGLGERRRQEGRATRLKWIDGEPRAVITIRYTKPTG